MVCPNHIVCGDTTENDNNLCHACAAYYPWSYMYKQSSIMFGTIPNVITHSAIPGTEYAITFETGGNELYEKLRLSENTGILKIEEMKHHCPICLEDKTDYFVTHPTCCIHNLCVDCFKNTVMDGTIEIKPPAEPETYSQYLDIVETLPEHHADTNWRNHPEPKEEWSEENKRIYREGVQHDLLDVQYEEEFEQIKKEKSNLRACSECRATILNI